MWALTAAETGLLRWKLGTHTGAESLWRSTLRTLHAVNSARTATPETADPGNPAEQRALQLAQRAQYELGAYAMLQASRPQTLSYALADSPVGQMVWIVERFKDWSDSTDVPEEAVHRDAMLTNVMIYWLNRTAGSSARYYYEGAATWGRPEPDTDVPVAVASCPTTSVTRSAASPNRTTTSCAGPSTNAAATSRPWKNPTGSSTTSGPRFATTASNPEPHRSAWRG